MAIVLAILAILVGGFGALLLSQATVGVGLLCLACLFGIFARLLQAEQQNRELRMELRKLLQKDGLPIREKLVHRDRHGQAYESVDNGGTWREKPKS